MKIHLCRIYYDDDEDDNGDDVGGNVSGGGGSDNGKVVKVKDAMEYYKHQVFTTNLTTKSSGEGVDGDVDVDDIMKSSSSSSTTTLASSSQLLRLHELPLTSYFSLYGIHGGSLKTTTRSTATTSSCSSSVDDYYVWIQADTKDSATKMYHALSSSSSSSTTSSTSSDEEEGKQDDDVVVGGATSKRDNEIHRRIFTSITNTYGNNATIIDVVGICTDQFGKNWIVSYSSKRTDSAIGQEGGGGGDKGDDEEEMMKVDLYLGYTNGQCFQAFEYYKNHVFTDNRKEQFDSKILYCMIPPNIPNVDTKYLTPTNKEQDGTKIMHMSLKASNDCALSLLGCDVIQTDDEYVNQMNDIWSGYTISITIMESSSSSEQRQRQPPQEEDGTNNKTVVTNMYKKLCQKVIMPLQIQFWGDYLGACYDRYGNSWNISCTNNKPPAS